MDAPDERPDNSRTDRRLAASTVEREYDGVDPHRCVRALEDRLDELGYRVGSTNWTLEGGSDGAKEVTTLRVRLAAVSMEDEVRVGSRPIEYRPYGPHGALAMLVGAIFALPTLFVSLALSVVGYYFYRKRRRAEVPVVRRDAIDVLVTGELTEGTRDALERGESTTADLHVSLAGEPTLAVDTNRLGSLEWPLRKAVVTQVEVWRDEIFERRATDRDVDDVFFDHLAMWRKRDPGADRETVASTQAELSRRRESRNAYTETLLEGSTVDLESDPDSEREGDVGETLEALAFVCEATTERE